MVIGVNASSLNANIKTRSSAVAEKPRDALYHSLENVLTWILYDGWFDNDSVCVRLFSATAMVKWRKEESQAFSVINNLRRSHWVDNIGKNSLVQTLEFSLGSGALLLGTKIPL